jgi:hypothetical protein
MKEEGGGRRGQGRRQDGGTYRQAPSIHPKHRGEVILPKEGEGDGGKQGRRKRLVLAKKVAKREKGIPNQ